MLIYYFHLPLNAYKKGITLTPFTGSHQTAFPSTGGMLETVHVRDNSQSYQYWHASDGGLYKRVWLNGEWGELVSLIGSPPINIPRIQQTIEPIPPGGDVTIIMDVPGALNTSTVVMSPYTPLNSGFIWTSGVQEPGKVFLRVTNLRTEEASPGRRSWAGKVFN